MAKYREYKNGIYGHRYNGLYVIKGEEKGQFKVIDFEKKEVLTDLLDFNECIWQIDKLTASKEELSMARMLYEKPLYQLSSLFMDLMQKKSSEGLDEKNEILFKWVEKVRNRKDVERDF